MGMFLVDMVGDGNAWIQRSNIVRVCAGDAVNTLWTTTTIVVSDGGGGRFPDAS